MIRLFFQRDALMSHSLLKSTSLVSAMTLISRLLGFFRDMLAAQIFGVNAAVDAFLVAFKFPNFMRSLFAEGAFSQAFVPTLADYRLNKTVDETRAFISYMAGSLSILLLIVTIIGILLMPWLVKLAAPGFAAYRLQLAIFFCRITFPYLMLISLAAFVGAILNSYSRFAIAALTPALLNICLIIGALYFTRYFFVPIESQVWGILIGGLLQLAFQLPLLRRIGLFTRPRLNWQDAGVRRVLKLMIPSIFGASVVQVGILINTIFASYLAVGSVTWLYYSERLAYFPQGVIGVALATVILPHLSRQFAKKSEIGFNNALNWGLRCNVLIGIPAALVMGVLAGPLVTTLFCYGHFKAFDVVMTQQSVMAYALGLPAFMLVKLLSSGFYARRDIRTPVRIGITMVGINILLNTFLIHNFAHAGLALATSIAAWLNAIFLLVILLKRKIYTFTAGWGIFSLRLVTANIFTFAWLISQQGHLAHWLNETTLSRIGHLAYILVVSMAIYAIVLLILGLRWEHLKVQVA